MRSEENGGQKCKQTGTNGVIETELSAQVALERTEVKE